MAKKKNSNNQNNNQSNSPNDWNEDIHLNPPPPPSQPEQNEPPKSTSKTSKKLPILNITVKTAKKTKNKKPKVNTPRKKRKIRAIGNMSVQKLFSTILQKSLKAATKKVKKTKKTKKKSAAKKIVRPRSTQSTVIRIRDILNSLLIEFKSVNGKINTISKRLTELKSLTKLHLETFKIKSEKGFKLSRTLHSKLLKELLEKIRSISVNIGKLNTTIKNSPPPKTYIKNYFPKPPKPPAPPVLKPEKKYESQYIGLLHSLIRKGTFVRDEKAYDNMFRILTRRHTFSMNELRKIFNTIAGGFVSGILSRLFNRQKTKNNAQYVKIIDANFAYSNDVLGNILMTVKDTNNIALQILEAILYQNKIGDLNRRKSLLSNLENDREILKQRYNLLQMPGGQQPQQSSQSQQQSKGWIGWLMAGLTTLFVGKLGLGKLMSVIGTSFKIITKMIGWVIKLGTSLVKPLLGIAKWVSGLNWANIFRIFMSVIRTAPWVVAILAVAETVRQIADLLNIRSETKKLAEKNTTDTKALMEAGAIDADRPLYKKLEDQIRYKESIISQRQITFGEVGGRSVYDSPQILQEIRELEKQRIEAKEIYDKSKLHSKLLSKIISTPVTIPLLQSKANISNAAVDAIDKNAMLKKSTPSNNNVAVSSVMNNISNNTQQNLIPIASRHIDPSIIRA